MFRGQGVVLTRTRGRRLLFCSPCFVPFAGCPPEQTCGSSQMFRLCSSEYTGARASPPQKKQPNQLQPAHLCSERVATRNNETRKWLPAYLRPGRVVARFHETRNLLPARLRPGRVAGNKNKLATRPLTPWANGLQRVRNSNNSNPTARATATLQPQATTPATPSRL